MSYYHERQHFEKIPRQVCPNTTSWHLFENAQNLVYRVARGEQNAFVK